VTDEMAASEARRCAAEVILQDEALTADLEDAEADALLRWAIPIAETVATDGLERGLPACGSWIAEALHPLRQVIRTANDLAANHTNMARPEFMARLLALLDAVWRLARLPSDGAASATSADAPPEEP